MPDTRDDMTTMPPSTASPEPTPAAHVADPVVPLWAALGVLLLLLAAVGAGGYVLRGFVGESPAVTGQEVVNAEIEKWTSEVEKDSESVPAHLGLAYAFQSDSQYDRALEEYAHVIRRDPSNTAALFQQGVIYLKLGLGQEGETSLWKALEYEPEHVQAATALGRYYAEREQYRSVVTAVRPAVVAHPDSAELQCLMGIAYENLDHRDWAIARYRMALDAAPDYVEAHEGLTRLGAPLDD